MYESAPEHLGAPHFCCEKNGKHLFCVKDKWILTSATNENGAWHYRIVIRPGGFPSGTESWEGPKPDKWGDMTAAARVPLPPPPPRAQLATVI